MNRLMGWIDEMDCWYRLMAWMRCTIVYVKKWPTDIDINVNGVICFVILVSSR